jgi:membrane protein
MKKWSALTDFVKEISQVWVNEKPNQLAAALAYFGMFSFAAVIYLAFRIAGLFINETAAAERLFTRIEAVLGAETAAFIQDSVSAIASSNTGGSLIVTVISSVSLLFAAMGLFRQLRFVLNRIWGVPLVQKGGKFAYFRQQLFPFIMVIALGLLLVLTTVVNLVFAWFGSLIQGFIGETNLISVLNLLALLGVIVLANAFIYKVLPDIKLAWRDVWPGSVVAALLMALGGLLIAIYFSLGGIHSAFEAAGAFAVLMISIYYFAQIFLVGAIITRIYTFRYGSKRESL